MQLSFTFEMCQTVRTSMSTYTRLFNKSTLFFFLIGALYFDSSNAKQSELSPEITSLYDMVQLSYYSTELTFDDAVGQCKLKNSSLVVVDTYDVMSALKSLIILKNFENQKVWEENVWTEVLFGNKSDNCSTSQYLPSPKIATVKVDTSQNLSLVATEWKNVSLNERYHFVCREEIEKCSESKTCSKETEKNVSKFDFEICSCKDGYEEGDNGTCQAVDVSTNCQSKVINSFTFPQTPVNEIRSSEEQCSDKGVTDTATIRCTDTHNPNFDPNTFQKISCSLTLFDVKINDDTKTEHELIKEVRKLQGLLTRDKILNVKEIKHAIKAIQNISRAVSKYNIPVSDNFFSEVVQTVSRLGNTDYPAAEKVDVVAAIENISTYVVFRERNYSSFPSKNVFAQIIKVDFSKENETITLPISDVGISSHGVSIRLPLKGLWDQISRGSDEAMSTPQFAGRNIQNISAEEFQHLRYSTIQIIIFYKPFLPYPEGTAEPIIFIQIGNLKERVELEVPMEISYLNKSTFYGPEARPKNDSRVVVEVDSVNKICGYYGFDSSEWKKDGLCLDMNSKTYPVCNSNHLTNFALLVSHKAVTSNVALNIFSQVGCGVILFSLLVTTILHLVNRKIKGKVSTKIRLHLYGNMILAYSVYFVGIERIEHKLACRAITVFLHYTFLTSFLWMAVYATRICDSVLKVFKQVSKNFLHKASLFVYGVPALVIAGNVLLCIMHYDKMIPTQFCRRELDRYQQSNYFRNNMCWINIPSLYYSFLLVLFLVLVYNAYLVFLIANKAFFSKKKIRSTAREKSSFEKICMITTLAVSIGLSWLFGYFLLIDPGEMYQTIFGWIFAILTASQGVVLLYISCFKNKEMFDFWNKPLRKAFSGSSNSSFLVTLPRSLRRKIGFTIIYGETQPGVPIKTETTLM